MSRGWAVLGVVIQLENISCTSAKQLFWNNWNPRNSLRGINVVRKGSHKVHCKSVLMIWTVTPIQRHFLKTQKLFTIHLMTKYWKSNTQIQWNIYCKVSITSNFSETTRLLLHVLQFVNLDMKNYSIYINFCFFLEGYHSYILQSDSYVSHRLLQVSQETASLLNLISIMQLYFGNNNERCFPL